MKHFSELASAISRRSFTKSIATATALVAAQIACKKSPDPCACDNPGDKPVKCQNIPSGLGAEPHEPPIIITNGSLKFDIAKALSDPQPITGHPVRHWKYRLAQQIPQQQGYGNIHRVQVITEREKLLESFFYYPNQFCHLKLWLQKRAGTGWESLTPEPQILIAYVVENTLPIFILETDAQLNAVESNKPARPNRYEHPGLGGNAYFRLAKWSMTNPDTGTVISPGFEDDITQGSPDMNGFQLAVSFEDLSRLIEQQKK